MRLTPKGCVLAAALAVGLAGCLVAVVILFPSAPSPSVDALVKNYKAHRADFRLISKMTASDPDFAVSRTYPAQGGESYGLPAVLTTRRGKRYRALLRDVGGQTLGSGRGQVEVTMGVWGLSVAGEDWGYSYGDLPPESDLSTIEQARAGSGDFGWEVYLGDGWYAYFTRN